MLENVQLEHGSIVMVSLLASSIKTVALGCVKRTLPAGTMRVSRVRENHSNSGSTIRSSNACRATVMTWVPGVNIRKIFRGK